MTEYVAGFLFNKDLTKVLLIEKLKPEWQAGKLNGIGGKIEPGEAVEEAMAREFKEETGIAFGQWRAFCRLHDEREWRVWFFTGITVDLSIARQMEAERPVVVDVNDLPDNIIPNLRWLIHMAADNGVREARVRCWS